MSRTGSLTAGDYNVFTIEWSHLADWTNYFAAAANTRYQPTAAIFQRQFDTWTGASLTHRRGHFYTGTGAIYMWTELFWNIIRRFDMGSAPFNPWMAAILTHGEAPFIFGQSYSQTLPFWHVDGGHFDTGPGAIYMWTELFWDIRHFHMGIARFWHVDGGHFDTLDRRHSYMDRAILRRSPFWHGNSAILTCWRRPFLTHGQSLYIFGLNYSETFNVLTWGPCHFFFDSLTAAILTYGQEPFIIGQSYSETFPILTSRQRHFDLWTAAILTCIWTSFWHSQHLCEVYWSFLRIKFNQPMTHRRRPSKSLCRRL